MAGAGVGLGVEAPLVEASTGVEMCAVPKADWEKGIPFGDGKSSKSGFAKMSWAWKSSKLIEGKKSVELVLSARGLVGWVLTADAPGPNKASPVVMGRGGGRDLRFEAGGIGSLGTLLSKHVSLWSGLEIFINTVDANNNKLTV